jgi:hypothetical protein
MKMHSIAFLLRNLPIGIPAELSRLAPSLCSTRTNFQSSGTNVQDSAVTSPFRGRTREDIQNANGSLTLQLPRRGSWRPDGVAATTLTTEASESGSDAS